ncbi:hypothetical protein ABZ883_26460 [Streptomyces sp. NPDC046977]|uniref:hypothetical protein n=1 Tax=Streptomyces sp. NPDC046977 TaxID=3154703 RepID=UPI0033DBE25A
MIFRFAPPGQDPKVWDLATVRFLSSEAEAVERATEKDWAWVNSHPALVVFASVVARRAVAWVLLKRETPNLRYSEFDPAIDDITVKLGQDDYERFLAEADENLASGRNTQEEYDEAMDELRSITDAGVLAVADSAPKAPEPEPLPELAPEHEAG